MSNFTDAKKLDAENKSRLCNALTIRRFQLLYNVPPTRYTPISPYPANTQDELDMRRKAEILQYNPTTQSSQTNSLTQKQRWSQTVRNRNQPINPNCPDLDMRPTPTTASGIPGPLRYLIRDTRVPLYNYQADPNAYAITAVEDTSLWRFSSPNNVFSNNDVSSKVLTLFISTNIDDPFKQFVFTTPYAIYIQGVNTTSAFSPTSPNSLKINDISFTILSAEAKVLYNNTETDTETVVALSNLSATYDISLNTATETSYSLFQYMGLLTITIPRLNTVPGYIFDLSVKFSVSITPPNTQKYYSNFNTNYFAVFCNLVEPSPASLVSKNATVHSSLVTPPFQTYKMVGT